MKKRPMKRKVPLGLAGAALLVAATAAALGLGAGRTHGSTASASAPQRDSISVHGRWTIQVRTPAGRIVTQRLFENALVGAHVLAQVFARQGSVGLWRIVLSAPDQPCQTGPPPADVHACEIREPGSSAPAEPWESKNLSVSYDSSAQAVVFSGSVNAGRTGEIGSVVTRVFVCDPAVPPSTPCETGFSPPDQAVTQKILSPPVAVQAGQQISVTVRITFS